MAWPADWQFKFPVTLDAANIDADLSEFTGVLTQVITDFPAAFWDYVDDGGGNLRFSTDEAGSSRMSIDVVKCDVTAEKLEVPYKLNVSSTTSTTFWVWCSPTGDTQPAVSDTYGQYAAYDGTTVVAAPLHETGLPYTNRKSASYHFNSGTAPTRIVGTIRDAQEFDGVNDYVRAAAAISGNHSTISVVFHPYVQVNPEGDAGSGQAGPLFAKPGANLPVAYFGSSAALHTNETLAILDAGTPIGTTYIRDVITAAYHHLAYRWNGTTYQVYLDGALKTGYPYESSPTKYCTLLNGIQWELGARTNVSNFRRTFIANFHVSSSARAAEWIKAESINLLTPATFAAAGTPETPSAAVTGTIAQQIAAAIQAISGTLTVTGSIDQAIKAAEQALSGTVTVPGVSGSIAQEIQSATQALTGKQTVTGDIAQTTPAMQQALSAVQTIAGTIAQQARLVEQSLEGILSISGDAMQEIASAQQAAAGTVRQAGTIAQQAKNAEQILAGSLRVLGAIVQEAPAATQAATGDIAVSSWEGTIAQTAAAATQSVAGLIRITGTIAQQLAAATQTATGAQGIIAGTIAQATKAATQALAGALVIRGQIAQITAAAEQAATGDVEEKISGTIAQGISGMEQAAFGILSVDGSIAQIVAPATQAAAGVAGGFGDVTAIKALNGSFVKTKALAGIFKAESTLSGAIS